MRIRCSKKILCLSLFIIILLLITLGSYHFLFPYKTEFYELFSGYCEPLQEKVVSSFECKAFVKGSHSQDSKTCLDLLFYTKDNELERKDLCIPNSIINWDNPYENYNKYIPVKVKASLVNNILGLSRRVDKIDVTLMSDEQLFEILNTIPYNHNPDKDFRNNVYIQEAQQIVENNYYITGKPGSGVKETLVIYSAFIENLDVETDILKISGKTKIKGEDLVFEILTKSFLYFETNFPLGATEEKGSLVNTENIISFEQEQQLQLFLDFKQDDFDCEDYLNRFLEDNRGQIFLSENFELKTVLNTNYEITF